MPLTMNESGIYQTRVFANGRMADVYAIAHGKARLGVPERDCRYLYEAVW